MPRANAHKTVALIDAAHFVLKEIQPASVRAVCYKLFTLGEIPDMSKNSTNKVGRAMVHARENGIIVFWRFLNGTARRISPA
ncbi:MAG: hypothetical protein ACRERV_04325 [Methylococcales bacterium]